MTLVSEFYPICLYIIASVQFRGFYAQLTTLQLGVETLGRRFQDGPTLEYSGMRGVSGRLSKAQNVCTPANSQFFKWQLKNMLSKSF